MKERSNNVEEQGVTDDSPGAVGPALPRSAIRPEYSTKSHLP